MKIAKKAALPVTLIVGLMAALPAFSHLADRTGSFKDHWPAQSFPIKWTLNPQANANIQGTGTRGVATVIQASFDTWTNAPNTTLAVSRQADSTQTSTGRDNVNLICFVCTGDFSKDSSTLAITLTTTDNSGQLLDADILFNPSVNFSTTGPSGVSPNRIQDLQTVATHEVGHFFGLSHSAITRAMMFPFAPDLQTTLSYDDVAGISALYPGAPVVPITTLSGTVRLNNAGVFGAHVYAESQTSAAPFSAFPNIRKSPISTLSLPDGSYFIEGVPADAYRVTAEPLDLPVSNGDVSDFAPAFGKTSVQTNFTTRWH